jgi:hypothetical protein
VIDLNHAIDHEINHAIDDAIDHAINHAGKTETIKELAKTLARPCIVFNCSLELDPAVIARHIAGTAQMVGSCVISS